MTDLNCEHVRDVYPDVLNGTANSALAQQARVHAASCEECRAEVALLDALHATRTALPSGLHERVVSAAQQRTPRRFSRVDVAMAATLAAALIGGSIIMQTRQSSTSSISIPSEEIGFVGVDDVMLSGKASLNDLSVEQLETLLEEIES